VKPLYRTLLMIGIAMGVVATSLIFGIGQGLVIHIQESNEIAEDMYAIYQPSGSAGVMGMSLPSVREIQRWLPEDIATSVISLEQREVDVQIGSDFYDAHIIGVDADLAQVFGLAITQGEFFTRDDQENRNPVCVVTNDLVELFGAEALESLVINGKKYQVIGAVQGDVNLGRMPHNNYSASSVFFPVEVWYEEFNDGIYDHGLIMEIAVYSPTFGKADLERILSQNIIHMENAPAVKVAAPGEQDYSKHARTLLILTGIFLIAFLVFLLAGLNIIQIASANVYDQQREFGLKAALGAQPKHLSREISAEIVACSLQGGYLGIVLAGIVNTIMNQYVGEYWAAFNIVTAIAGMLLALLVGWITSVIPARQAAKIDPVLVLKQEVR